MQDINYRKLNRLKGYDYSQAGWYFITICTKNRAECLGEIKNEEMVYSRYGEIVLKYWQAIPAHYPNIFLDKWVIMPNHIHGIIVIDNFSVGTEQCSVPTTDNAIIRTEQCSVPTTGNAIIRTEQCSVPTTENIKNYGLLSKIVKSFKEISIKSIRGIYNDHEFAWQRSFYDHIIRGEKSLGKIRHYIYCNPIKWEIDRNNSENLWF